jgi:hypothetical protein
MHQIVEFMTDVLQCMGGKMQCKTDVTATDERIYRKIVMCQKKCLKNPRPACN